jgi:hypothetical protein
LIESVARKRLAKILQAGKDLACAGVIGKKIKGKAITVPGHGGP